MSDYKTITEWETYEGAVTGYNDNMVAVIEIAALQDRDQCLRWNIPYVPGRYWYVTHEDGTYGTAQELIRTLHVGGKSISRLETRNRMFDST